MDDISDISQCGGVENGRAEQYVGNPFTSPRADAQISRQSD